MIKYKYYQAVGGRADVILKYIISQYKDRTAKQKALMAKYGCDDLFFQGKELKWLGFPEPVDRDYLIHNGRYSEGGSIFHVYRPNKRYKEGKLLAEAMENAGLFNYSEYICRVYKVVWAIIGDPCEGSHGVFVYNSGGWVQGDKIMIRIPYDDAAGLPEIPPDLVEVPAPKKQKNK